MTKEGASSTTSVCIWDLDETLILFNSILTQEYQRGHAEKEQGAERERWEQLLAAAEALEVPSLPSLH